MVSMATVFLSGLSFVFFVLIAQNITLILIDMVVIRNIG